MYYRTGNSMLCLIYRSSSDRATRVRKSTHNNILPQKLIVINSPALPPEIISTNTTGRRRAQDTSLENILPEPTFILLE